MPSSLLSTLLASPNPAIQFKTRTLLLGEPEDSPEAARLREFIRTSPLALSLLTPWRTPAYDPPHPYHKWQGAHWVLASLAEIGYPPGDEALRPLMESVYAWLFSEEHLQPNSTIRYSGQEDRVRRHASMEGNAIWYSLKLGLADARTDQLAERLCQMQWPDGGWNCDRRKEASHSSFHESWLPLRGLGLHARLAGNPASQNASAQAAARSAEHFLQRRLFRRLSDGEVIRPDFLNIRYPYYWWYGILPGLLALAEAGYLTDPRTTEALDLLAARRTKDGGFPAEISASRQSSQVAPGLSFAAWDPHGTSRMNEYVTVDALWVLKSAGRDIDPR